MVYISLDELLPTSRAYGKGHDSLLGLLGGMAVMALSLLLMLSRAHALARHRQAGQALPTTARADQLHPGVPGFSSSRRGPMDA